MRSKRLYNISVGLFPIIYLFHNTEEWLVLKLRIGELMNYVPPILRNQFSNDPNSITAAYGIALIIATIISLIVSIIIWNKLTELNVKILLIIAFVTLINAISHISSTFALGFLSPGVITGVLLCLPYSFAMILFIRKHYMFNNKQYLFLGLGSVGVFICGIALSWILGALIMIYL